VARQASASGHQVTGTSSADLDITGRSAVAALVGELRPGVIVSTAYRADSWKICAEGAANVALAAAHTGARLVHLSTDALHAGRPTPYLDDDPPTPVHAYGAAKAAAETAVAGPEALNRAEMGRLIARSHGLDPSSVPTSTIAEGNLGPRPADVRLDSTRATSLLKTRLRPASETLAVAPG
jgi:dTDP-4-dehydrorhamnose reductase